MRQLAVLGLGLIGGSLAWALRDSCDVTVWDPDDAVLSLAAEAGFHTSRSPLEAYAEAELSVLCGPLGKLAGLVEALAPHWRPGSLMSDVGGVKAPVVAAARRYLPPGAFVGGHPMAGGTQIGFSAASPDLFRGAVWALTPDGPQEEEAALKVAELLAPTGARFTSMAVSDHDRAVAFTSNLPYLLSVAMARAAKGASREGLPKVTELRGPGFWGATRLALTEPQRGTDTIVANKDAILLALSAFRYELSQLEILVQQDMSSTFKTLAQDVSAWRSDKP